MRKICLYILMLFALTASGVKEKKVGVKGGVYTYFKAILPIPDRTTPKMESLLAGIIFDTSTSSIREAYRIYRGQYDEVLAAKPETKKLAGKKSDLFQVKWISFVEGCYACADITVREKDGAGKNLRRVDESLIYDLRTDTRLFVDDIFMPDVVNEIFGQNGSKYWIYILSDGRVSVQFMQGNERKEAVFSKEENRQVFLPSFIELLESAPNYVPVGDTESLDVMPSFPGGKESLFKFLKNNFRYPIEAKKEKVEGRVVVDFVIAKDGSVLKAEVTKSVHPALDKEALRLIWAMPSWNPGYQDGKPVAVKYHIPFTFRLSEKGNTVELTEKR